MEEPEACAAGASIRLMETVAAAVAMMRQPREIVRIMKGFLSGWLPK